MLERVNVRQEERIYNSIINIFIFVLENCRFSTFLRQWFKKMLISEKYNIIFTELDLTMDRVESTQKKVG